jgi:putative ABC transport system permease protein
VLRALLHLYPRAFRERFGDDMADVARDRARGSRRAWIRTLGSILANAPAEWLIRRPVVDPPPKQQQSTSNSRGEDVIDSLVHDIRYAFRGMIRRPGFTAVILATLTLGIGANVGIFSVVEGVLLRPLVYHKPEGIIRIAHLEPFTTVSEPEFADYKRGARGLSQVAAVQRASGALTGTQEPERIEAARVSDGFFNVLGVSPRLGRWFTTDEDKSGGPPVVILSHGLWQRRFGGDASIVGKPIVLNGAPRTVVGVMPPGFDYPSPEVSIWVPLRLNFDSLWTRNNHYLTLIARLAPGVTVAKANAELNAMARQFVRDYPDTYGVETKLVAEVTPIRDVYVGATRPYLLALIGAVGFVLLIACVNVANLLLARGESRRKELAIRTALGASRKRVVRQVLTESAAYALIGGLLGLGLAVVGGRALLALAPSNIPRLDEVRIDLPVLWFTALLSIATGLLFGAIPAFRGAKADVHDTLKQGGKTSTVGYGMRSARSLLVASEVALAVVTFTGAGLMVRSLWNLQAIDLGFTPERVLTMDVRLPERAYPAERSVQFYRDLTIRLAAVPGVEAASAVGDLPITEGFSNWSILIDGMGMRSVGDAPSAMPQQVTPDYFKALGIPLVRGRVFTDADRDGAPLVAVVNETMAKKLWPGKDAIGGTVKMLSPDAPWATVVGIVKDVRSEGYVSDVPPTMYFPHAQSAASAYYAPTSMSLVIKTTGNPTAVAGAAQAAIRAMEPSAPISRVLPMDRVVSQSIANRTFTTLLLASFAGLALVLAGIGIYGVIAYTISQRTFEIGLRMALGASRGVVLTETMAHGMRMAVVGLIFGIAGATATSGLLSTLLVGVKPIDAATLSAAAFGLIVVAALASYIPARRATAVDPVTAIRAE